MNDIKQRFAIAFSFPGETRDIVQRIADKLALRFGKERVLYDRFHEAEFARPNLDVHLQELYHKQSELIVVVLCKAYQGKDWPGLEWRAIRDLIKQRHQSIMFLRFDEAEVDGVYGIDGYIDIGGRTPDELADLIAQRHKQMYPGSQPIEAPRRPKITEPRRVMVAGACTIALVALLWLLNRATVPTKRGGGAFKLASIASSISEVSKRLSHRLGPPVQSEPVALNSLRYQRYQRAAVLWVDTSDSARFYVLRTQPKPQFYRINDDEDYLDDCHWEKTSWLRSNIKKCEGLLPPSGGVAKLFLRHRLSWDWIGCLEWERWYGKQFGYAENTMLHEFRDGFIIGPVNAGRRRDDEWIVFTLFKGRPQSERDFDGDWSFQKVSIEMSHPAKEKNMALEIEPCSIPSPGALGASQQAK